MSLKEDISKFIEQVAKHIPQETFDMIRADNRRMEQSGLAGKSLKAGEKAPLFALPNARGERISSADLLKQGPLVLSFYRGGWCPYCNMELRALQQALPEINENGASLIAVSPQLPDHSLSTAEKNALSFDVLSDVGNEVARAYGLVFTLAEKLRPLYLNVGVDIPAINGDNSFELPIPATFVIDTEGTIDYAFVEADYFKRLEPSKIIDVLKTIKTGA